MLPHAFAGLLHATMAGCYMPILALAGPLQAGQGMGMAVPAHMCCMAATNYYGWPLQAIMVACKYHLIISVLVGLLAKSMAGLLQASTCVCTAATSYFGLLRACLCYGMAAWRLQAIMTGCYMPV